MKKLVLLALLFCFTCMPTFAKSIKVEALSDFSSDNPPRMYKVKIIDEVTTQNSTIPQDSILEGRIIVTNAARLKRDATFSFIPTTLTEPDGHVIKVRNYYEGKYSKGINKAKLAKTVALTAGNFAVKGLSTGYTAIEGAVKNEENNRLKSSAKAVYESTPVSYIEKGKSLEIKKGDQFYINFKTPDEEEIPKE